MFIPHLFTATVVTAIHVGSVISFQPGSDYGLYKTTNLYNCTGQGPVSNVTIPNAFDTLPQIEHSVVGCGWEQWSLFLHGTFPIILRWNQGDPSSSLPSSHFDILVAEINGTTVQATAEGELSYTNGERIKQITIGDNSLAWDADARWYNVSVNIDGYQLILDSYSATLDSFHPNVAFYDGLLDQSGSWYGSIPLIRGHVVGTFSTPSSQTFDLDGLSVMRHIFAEKPLPSHVKRYTTGTCWGHSKTFYDSHLWYQTETINGTVHEAAFLGRAIPERGQTGLFSSAWATYAVTDDTKLYSLTIDPLTHNANASFSGCSNTDDIPYLFNITASTLLGEFVDLAGGKTSYYSVNGTTSAAFNGHLTKGAVVGVVEDYQVPSPTIGIL